MRASGHDAEPPRAPGLRERDKRDERARKLELQRRVGREQQSMLRGLILLAVTILVVSLARAGFGRLFVPGWWNQW